MREPRGRAWGWSDDEGSSLAEVAVAAVLLVTVLVPTALSVVALTGASEVEVRREALVRARSGLEATLATAPGTWRGGEEADGPWRTVRTVEREAGYASLRVEVYRGGRGPLVTLVAGRTDPGGGP